MQKNNIRNRVNFNNIPKPESKENILASFIGGLGDIGANVGRAAQQLGQGVATGAQTGGAAIGQGLKKMYGTPEGKLALQSLIGEALIDVGQEDLGEGIQEYAQTVYTPNVQRSLYETQQRAETKKAAAKAKADAEKAEKERQQKLLDEQRKRMERITDALFLDAKKKEQDPTQARYSARTQASHMILSEFESQKNPYYTNTKKFLKDQTAPYMFKSDEYKQIEQAQRDFLNATLRRESGAAIAESEFKNAQLQYFPQPGDTPEVVKQKQKNREMQFAKIEALQKDAKTLTDGYDILNVRKQ